MCQNLYYLQYTTVLLHTFQQREQILMKKYSIYNILHFFNTLFVFFMILFRTCLAKFKSINLVDTGRKLNVHKTFRRRPGRLLNVLCTFNLRLVSTGKLKCYFTALLYAIAVIMLFLEFSSEKGFSFNYAFDTG